jgi:hypothetical protein
MQCLPFVSLPVQVAFESSIFQPAVNGLGNPSAIGLGFRVILGFSLDHHHHQVFNLNRWAGV